MAKDKILVEVTPLVQFRITDREMAQALLRWAVDTRNPSEPGGFVGLRSVVLIWKPRAAKKVSRWISEYYSMPKVDAR